MKDRRSFAVLSIRNLTIATLFSDCVEDLHQPGIILNGKITPCHGTHSDIYACGAAISNAPSVAKVKSGMTVAEVRELLEHDLERKTIDGQSSRGATSPITTLEK
jgi:hypothetical protein